MKTADRILNPAVGRLSQNPNRGLTPSAGSTEISAPAPPADELAHMLPAYLRLRKAGLALQNQLIERVIRAGGFEESARKLGVLRGKAFVLESEHEMAVIADHALVCHRPDGLNVVERCFQEARPADADTQMWLEGLLQSHYTLSMAKQIITGFGMQMVDIISGEPFLVADVNLSMTAEPGFTMAARIVPLRGFSATTGASLPIVSENTLAEISQYVTRRFPKLKDVRSLDPHEAGELQTFITRTCLASHASLSLRTTDPGDMRGLQQLRGPTSSPGVYSRKMKIGRNEQCPCGSGEKFKRCCGRGLR